MATNGEQDGATGLVLGKFAPLHRGHQCLIETALDETSRVIVVIYDCPETTGIPLVVRSRWIADLYPRVEILEAWDGPTEVGNAPEIRQRHEMYLGRILAGRRITHFYSSEFYGDHVSRFLGAIDRRIDPNREKFSVSGTAIRENPHAFRNLVTPRVYRDLITNIVFLGAPSTGKSTIAQRLAERFSTVWMPEYGREYWDQHQLDRRLTSEQLVEIAEEHLRREDILLYEANRYCFTDTNALTTYTFALDYHGTVDSRLAELARTVESRYDLVFLCGTDIPYEDTWDRSGAVHREVFQKRIVADLAMRKIPYFSLCGSLEDRIRRVVEVIGHFDKYRNLVDTVLRLDKKWRALPGIAGS